MDGMTECFGDTEKAVSVTQTCTFSSQAHTCTFYFQVFPRNLKIRFRDVDGMIAGFGDAECVELVTQS